MSNKNVIDTSVIETLKEIMGDDFGIIVHTFVDDTGRLVSSLVELHSQNDVEVFTRNAHSIKSSSANVGALQLSAIAAGLEAQGISGDITNTSAKIATLLSEFKTACDELNALT